MLGRPIRKKRKPAGESSWFQEAVLEAFCLTTVEERRTIAMLGSAREWWNMHHDLVRFYRIPPLALLVASMLDQETDLLFNPRSGMKYTFLGSAQVLVRERLRGNNAL